MRYLVNFSTGLASFEAARRTIEQKGRENTTVIFCDVRGDAARDSHAAPLGSNWDGEDDDNYRFLADAQKLLGVEIVRLSHPEGLGVWGTIFKERKISIRGAGGLMFAPCSRALKMEIVDAYAATIEEEITQVLGLTWLEDERVLKATERARHGKPCDVWFPLTEPPFVDNCHIAAWLEARGVQPPRSYRQGYIHSNCGGACIKAGLSQWAALLRDNRGRFLYNERQEGQFRAEINSNVAILRDQSGGTVTPLPLDQFRREVESGARKVGALDWGGCGCFAPSPQMRFDELALEAATPRSANKRPLISTKI